MPCKAMLRPAGLPVVPEIITSAQATGVSSAYKLLYALRLLRLVRVARLLRVSLHPGHK